MLDRLRYGRSYMLYKLLVTLYVEKGYSHSVAQDLAYIHLKVTKDDKG